MCIRDKPTSRRNMMYPQDVNLMRVITFPKRDLVFTMYPHELMAAACFTMMERVSVFHLKPLMPEEKYDQAGLKKGVQAYFDENELPMCAIHSVVVSPDCQNPGALAAILRQIFPLSVPVICGPQTPFVTITTPSLQFPSKNRHSNN